MARIRSAASSTQRRTRGGDAKPRTGLAGAERLVVLQEMIVRRLQDAMMVGATDDDYWTPPQAAIEVGLHYQYIAQALLTGELSCDLREVRVARGKQRSVVISSDDVVRWYQDREADAEDEGTTLAEYLTKRYSMQQVFQSSKSSGSNLGEGVPDDVVPIDLASQAFASHYRLDPSIFDAALDVGSIVVYEVGGERMVSEQDVVNVGEAADDEMGVMVKVLDDGPLSPKDASVRLGISEAEIVKAIEREELMAADDGTLELSDIVDWYDAVRKAPKGKRKERFLLIRAGEDDDVPACDSEGLEPSHYDMERAIPLCLPCVPAIVETVDAAFVRSVVERQHRFGVGHTVPIAPDIKHKTVSVMMTIRTLESLAYLANRDRMDLETYLSLAALST